MESAPYLCYSLRFMHADPSRLTSCGPSSLPQPGIIGPGLTQLQNMPYGHLKEPSSLDAAIT